MSDKKSKITADHSHVGVIGDNTKVEGGIHFHFHQSSVITPEVVRKSSNPKPYAELARQIYPGGAMETDSQFYIKRAADNDVFGGISRLRGLVTVRGPRQTGKTSLMMQIYMKAKHSDVSLRPVFVDFQALSLSDFESLDTLWNAVAGEAVYQLGITDWNSDAQDQTVRYDRRLSRFLDYSVFAKDDTPLLMCLDEVDRVFLSPLRTEFFASIRAFYNRGAFDPAWKRVRWLLNTSSEPAFFIENLNQSPFNIGLRVELKAFTPDETAEFARLHGLSLNQSLIDRIMAYLGGHPYLVHLFFYHMVVNPESRKYLLNSRSAGGGIFLEHLKYYLKHFREEPNLATAMRQVIDGQGCDNMKIADRLEAAGLVRCDEKRKLVCFCDLYADFFGREL